MRFALVNPRWSFDRSVYFGCREAHLPLEFGYAKLLLEREGHEALILDAALFNLSPHEIKATLKFFKPDFSVVTTAPSYLFWRCPPPELRCPQETMRALREVGGTLVGVGPHCSVTPSVATSKLGADMVIVGEFEDVLPLLATPVDQPEEHGILIRGRNLRGTEGIAPNSTDVSKLPPLTWDDDFIRAHSHHHHRFGTTPEGSGAEVEASRGCPFYCSFCAKERFRTNYRKRPLDVVSEEIDHLLAQGVRYIYFIDEIFMPDEKLLEFLDSRPVKFGVQLRIDLWGPEMLQKLGEAGCVSIEAGVESISEKGRQRLGKNCRLSQTALMDRLIWAKMHVPFVQANLMLVEEDRREEVETWREKLLSSGVWVNKPVPLFPYPGSDMYRKNWGEPDDQAWERAQGYYIQSNLEFSDIQDDFPLPVQDLELGQP